MRFGIALSVLFLVIHAFAAEMTAVDLQYKNENLSKLRAHDPGDQMSPEGKKIHNPQDDLWKKFIDLSVRYEDTDIMKRMFAVESETDGMAAEQYPIDLYEIYNAKPIFFLKSAEKYFKGGLNSLAVTFINEKEDFTIEQMVAPLKGIRPADKGYELAQKFKKILAEKKAVVR
jgi:hypothetical protein